MNLLVIVSTILIFYNSLLVDNAIFYTWSDEATTIMEYWGPEQHVRIPNKCTKISRQSFSNEQNRENIKSVFIPAGVADIEFNPFDSLHNLESITIAEENPKYSSQDGILYDKNKTKFVAYPSNKQDTELKIPNTILQLQGYPFQHIKMIESVILNDVVKLENNDFVSAIVCLKSYKVSDSNPYYTCVDGVLFDKSKQNLIAFPPSNSEHEYTVPTGTVSIGENAFNNSIIEAITLPNTLTNVESNAFIGSKIQSLTIPGSLKEVGVDSFFYAMSLEKLTISPGVKKLKSGAFLQCPSLKYITLPETLTDIGNSAISNCESLKMLVIPKSVVRIEDFAFAECNKLEYLIFKGRVHDEIEELAAISGCEFRPRGGTVYRLTGLDLSINGKLVDYDFASPFIDQNNQVQIPLEITLDALGAKVQWVDENKTVRVTIDEKEAVLILEDPPLILNDVIYCSLNKLKNFMKNYNATVEYDSKNFMIKIKDKP